MSERWVPVLAAVVGLVGGMAGAYIGGTVANEGQQQRFEEEQKAETRNLRIDAYVDLLKACETTFYIPADLHGTKRGETEINRRIAVLRAAQARASLLTSLTTVRQAARELQPDGGDCGDVRPARHVSAQESFIEAAHPEIAPPD
jgi:hypothetical protein